MLTNTNIVRDPRRVGERNDCAVCAVANVANVSYGEAHALLAACGRRARCGTPTRAISAALQSLVALGKLESSKTVPFLGRPTVAQYLRMLPRNGRFLLCAAEHAFAYVDGEIRDNLSRPKMRGRMFLMIEVKLAAPKAEPKAADLSQADISAMWERLKRIEGRL